ncbi:MAG TPA: FAD:protein FMN transferase [Bryobacteraceae bacterium]|nr:FAD:protein FMN transferase [Bryobacteraceae bacterium]
MKQIVLVLFLLPLVGAVATARPAAKADTLRLESSVVAMGSAYSVVVYGEDRTRMEEAVDAAFAEVQRLDQMLSNYKPESELSEINRYAGEHPVAVTQEMFDLLAACVEYSRESEGAFDITVGPLMKVWGFYKGTGRLPHRAEILSAMDRVGYRNIVLDATQRTVRFAKEGTELDPGGIGKGYAVDRMVEVLKQYGVQTALVSASGSSIYGLGAPPGEKGWKVEIRDPKNEKKSVAEVYLKDESMSTSGNYEKFFRAEGRIYSHIMDPRTGWPAQGALSVSAITPRTIDSEAWTKPLFVNGRAWASKHKPAGLRAFFCEDTAEQTCAWLQ